MTRRGVVFDVDGTLVDSNYLHVVAWLRAFRATGHDEVRAADVHRRVGMGADLFVKDLLGEPDETATKAHAEEYRRCRPDLRPFPGAVDLLREVRRCGGETVLATSATEEEVEALRGALGCDDVITSWTCSADVDQAKPDPDVFTTAVERAGLDDCVVVGDTVWDAEAARRAGLRCVGVLSGGIAREVLLGAGMVEVYDDVAALLSSFDDSSLGALLR